jgi:nitrite reductase/ring-hydroxylating ferredoxin subunit/uncharacterized membrane protein
VRSRASYKGHPIHPAIIPFPFAFLTGAFVFDAFGWIFSRPSWSTTGGHLAAAGVLSALVAAIPGAIDYLYSVPPKSSGKKRATQHLVINLSAVIAMAVAWLLRSAGTATPPLLALEFVAVTLLLYGSSMGGVLVTRNQISVDHRYADAGRWRETTIDGASSRIAVAAAEELKPNQMKLLHLASRRIVLGRTETGYVAFDDRCTHRGGPLADGVMICGTVQCPWHGSQFDVQSGIVKAGPAREGIQTYRVEAKDGQVWLSLPSQAKLDSAG